MEICDICYEEEGIVTRADTYCKTCHKAICEKHTDYYEGYRCCPNCDLEGELDCPICELPLSMCSCK